MKISQKLAQAHSGSQASRPTYSFEYFVPKTTQGVQNLYDRMDRMYDLGPAFIDVTWNAGGSTESPSANNLTTEIVATAQGILGLETCMHLTCTGMPKETVEAALEQAYKAGCQNILALRGDKAEGKSDSDSDKDTFIYAKDLIRFIRNKYGDYFDICVAGYPEGHPEEPDPKVLIKYLKEKVDAGANFVITQMFYNVDTFLSWVQQCREAGINVPIIPGIMPISTYASFLRRANWCQVDIPKHFLEALEPIKGDDSEVREVGTQLVADMCRKMLANGITHLHFYTMNLERATIMILESLSLLEQSPAVTPQEERPTSSSSVSSSSSLKVNNPPLPWRQSLGLTRKEESVRPIFWKNRKHSYVARTQDWDEFPNGRWGDSRSPAYGELERYGGVMRHSSARAREIWGQPASYRELASTFVRYINGKTSSLPWSDSPISAEVDEIKPQLIDLNTRGILTINSQPSVNGVPSNHPVHGWGPAHGYVYQKAYLELLVPESLADKIIAQITQDPQITYYSVDNAGHLETNAPENGGPNAVTWGIYPGHEVIQPTIVEKISFLAWKDEAFKLAHEWARCCDKDSAAQKLLNEVADQWRLINIVHNDFQSSNKIFEALAGISAF
ncbi:uncharacterized protein SAPINGB_P005168 [Magnusiomyces paraingens]|uniref:MTHFR SAM-binding regulatory domain-containing protein n=1 Tax=Magnusiomyces paraingens TaxID=2606893 RepID=A0A5E8BYM2_9ASCO|nr:uncharacterized protein SAPINGB_P005168 [Saprochaete ingens]VVT56594.1 unnamed protein product [Saprochaete ingens]